MAAPYVPNTAYMYWPCTLNGSNIGFGYHAEFLTPPYDQADIDNLAEIGDTWFSGQMLPLMSVSAAYIGCQVRGLNAAIDLEAFENSGAGVGGSANTPLPNNVSFVIKHSTGFTGRSARGRSYMIAIPNNVLSTDEDQMGVAQAQDYVDAFIALDVALDAGGWDGVVVSRYSAGVLRTTPITTRIIDHLFVDTTLDTRRKRLQ